MTLDVYDDLFDPDAEAVADARFGSNAAKLRPNVAGRTG
jgi:hypothetical protein